ncbi:MAG TPA: DoxX family membrane protein [Bacteroides sp.]|nr:DoxX family membrane protein [Bacteroides sp.]
MRATTGTKLNQVSLWVLSILRMAIGWHFLYEGIVKLVDPGWTSASYLVGSRWLFSGAFQWIATHPGALQVVDFLNIWGLILIGLGLMLGFLARYAAMSGILLLALYYVASPPFISSTGAYLEGHYIWIDKNLIELIALVVLLVIPTSRFIGLDGLLEFVRRKARRPVPGDPAGLKAAVATDEAGKQATGRRVMLRQLATLPVLGAFTYAAIRKNRWESYEEKFLTGNTDATTGATLQNFSFSSLKDLKGSVPKGRIGDLEISRLIAGGNLIGGWAHSRDLIYVSKLVKAYHHDQKVFETLKIAEACGINAILTNPQLNRVINRYWRTQGGNIRFISDCGYQQDPYKGIELSIQGGAHACYVQGEISDRFVPAGRVDELGECVEIMRRHGVPGGIGAHKLETIKACVEAGIKPDFWVKTIHHVDYWSARPEEEMDNIWCRNPGETIAYMGQLEAPWIGFKILAAGAIHPEVGFPYAFKAGVDFICVGMYDFQVVEDANMTLAALADPAVQTGRQRPWRA